MLYSLDRSTTLNSHIAIDLDKQGNFFRLYGTWDSAVYLGRVIYIDAGLEWSTTRAQQLWLWAVSIYLDAI